MDTGSSGRSRMILARWIGLALLGLVVLADAGYAAAVVATREPAPRPLTGDRIFHASRPAVVLVQGEYHVTASVPDAELAPGKQQDIDNQLLAMVRAGKLPLNDAKINQAAFDIMAANPDAYFRPSSTRLDDSFVLDNSGTGFFVTEDGYLVTASHVVSATNADLKAEILDIDQEPANLAKARAGLKQSLAAGGFTATDAELDRLAGWWQTWEARYLTLDRIDARYYLAGGASVEAGDHVTATGTRASLIKEEPVYPDRDVALLKANVSSVPALRLAAKDPEPGQADYVIGYPRKGYLQEAAPFNASVPIVLSSGKVQTRIARSNWTAYGTDADVTHGNSGGPVLDSSGDVLGVISFGTDAAGGAPAQNYFVPSGVVSQLLEKAGVTARPGSATAGYYRALQLGDAHRYKYELPMLQALAARTPDDAYVKDDVMAAQSALLSGKDKTPPELLPYAPAAAGALAGALLFNLGALVAGLLGRRRRAALPVAETAAAS